MRYSPSAKLRITYIDGTVKEVPFTPQQYWDAVHDRTVSNYEVV